MKKEIYLQHFKDKKITIMGLGILGRGIQVSKFLAECGAQLTITDLKPKKDLKKALDQLKKYKIRYVLGKHDTKDFENADLIVKAAGVPLDSIYIHHAKKQGIPVAMDASLFAKIVQDQNITIIGITGTRGKSMTTALVYHILKQNEKNLRCKIWLGGNMRNTATLPLLAKVSQGDIAVLELDSWQCQGFADEKISPHLSVFTSFMSDHMNYYKDSMQKYFYDKSSIYRFQKKEDFIITNKDLAKKISKHTKSKVIVVNGKHLADLSMHIFGEHTIQNAAYAYQTALLCGISPTSIEKSLQSFRGLEGRLESIRILKNIYIINDNNATTPEATAAGILAVKQKYPNKGIILLVGGSSKGLDLEHLSKLINKYHPQVFLLPGTGTNELKQYIQEYTEHKDLKAALRHIRKIISSRDIFLFSPGFASFGLFKNEYERNDQFLKIIRSWR